MGLMAGLCKRNSVVNVALFLNYPNHTTRRDQRLRGLPRTVSQIVKDNANRAFAIRMYRREQGVYTIGLLNVPHDTI